MSLQAESDVGQKRKKLTGDERLNRNRERNRVHARKTRERKKNQTAALQSRIHELFEEGTRLRQLVDERFTASSLLNLCNSHPNGNGGFISMEPIPIVPSSQICSNYYLQLIQENSWLRDGSAPPTPFTPPVQEKRVRRSGKYTPQERERIRRERNRMHAKKTRDRKKFFLEMSEKIITEMENESKLLREYLLSLHMISEDECRRSFLRDIQSKQELAHLKGASGGEDNDDDSSENEDGDAEEEPLEEDEDREEQASSAAGVAAATELRKQVKTRDRERERVREREEQDREEPSVSDGNSEDNEKNGSNDGSWNGSNDGSSNPDSTGNSSTDRSGSADNSSKSKETSSSSSSNAISLITTSSSNALLSATTSPAASSKLYTLSLYPNNPNVNQHQPASRTHQKHVHNSSTTSGSTAGHTSNSSGSTTSNRDSPEYTPNMHHHRNDHHHRSDSIAWTEEHEQATGDSSSDNSEERDGLIKRRESQQNHESYHHGLKANANSGVNNYVINNSNAVFYDQKNITTTSTPPIDATTVNNIKFVNGGLSHVKTISVATSTEDDRPLLQRPIKLPQLQSQQSTK